MQDSWNLLVVSRIAPAVSVGRPLETPTHAPALFSPLVLTQQDTKNKKLNYRIGYFSLTLIIILIPVTQERVVNDVAVLPGANFLTYHYLELSKRTLFLRRWRLLPGARPSVPDKYYFLACAAL